MFPATGSTMIAATRPALASSTASVAARSLYGATSVSAVAPGVTPGLSGRPNVATPEPAFTRSASACPW